MYLSIGILHLAKESLYSFQSPPKGHLYKLYYIVNKDIGTELIGIYAVLKEDQELSIAELKVALDQSLKLLLKGERDKHLTRNIVTYMKNYPTNIGRSVIIYR